MLHQHLRKQTKNKRTQSKNEKQSTTYGSEAFQRAQNGAVNDDLHSERTARSVVNDTVRRAEPNTNAPEYGRRHRRLF